MAKGSSLSKTAVWILLGLLIVGLAGFGATNLTGSIRSIGNAGDKTIAVEDYARQLQQEIRSVQAQTGRAFTFAEAQEIGLDRAVLQRLVATRSMDHETSELGLSVGDEELRNRVLQIAAFQGVGGEFDREGYRFALEQAGLTETAFEERLREEVARTIVQGAVIGGVVMPEAYVDTIVNFIGEERSFTWSLLTAEDLATPVETPGDEVLTAFYEENIDAYTLPETRKITYAWLDPDTLVDEVEIDENALREAFEERAAEFDQPERRLVERLVFLDTAAAEAAAAAIAGGAGFESLVEERGLGLEDVDLGDVTEAELGDAGPGVFAAEIGTVVGPFASDVGPALFRVNAVLAAQVTPYEEAVEILRPQIAADRARRLVEAQAETFDDMLAAGATLEELAGETDMVADQIDWSVDSTEGIAAYEAFRTAAAAVTPEDFPQIASLDDGGLFALRLDEVLAPRPALFEEVREQVLADWQAVETGSRLAAQLRDAAAQLEAGNDFNAVGLDAIVEERLLRTGFVPGAPRGFLAEVFAMSEGDIRVIEGDARALIVRLDTIAPPSEDGDAVGLRDQIALQATQALSQDIFEVYGADVVRRADPQINRQAVQAVHVNFP